MMEGNIHLQLKEWTAKQFERKGVDKNKIILEKQLWKKRQDGKRLRSTKVDVYIENAGKTAVYCQCNTSNIWLINFIDKKLPIAKEYCSNIMVVIPYNLEILWPVTFFRHMKEFKRLGIEVWIAPIGLNVKDTTKVQIYMSYDAMDKLCRLRNKYQPNKTIVEFVEKDIEKLVKSCNGR